MIDLLSGVKADQVLDPEVGAGAGDGSLVIIVVTIGQILHHPTARIHQIMVPMKDGDPDSGQALPLEDWPIISGIIDDRQNQDRIGINGIKFLCRVHLDLDCQVCLEVDFLLDGGRRVSMTMIVVKGHRTLGV